MRLPKVEAATGATFRWRPFNVRQIMIEMDNIPFAKKPAKPTMCGAMSSGVRRCTG